MNTTIAQQIANQLGEEGLVVSTQESAEANATVSFLTKGLANASEASVTALLLNYLFDTQRRNLEHIVPAESYERLAYLKFNQDTRTNLDLVDRKSVV